MKEFFSTYPLAAWSLVSTMVALTVVALLWERIKWWWFNTWVTFPVIGKIARLSSNATPDSSHPGWFTAERTLCQEYKDFVHIQDENDFNEKVTYLTKAGDNGRKATPAWIWVLTILMVFVEAMGFSYVLAGYTIPGASENLQQTGAYGIAFLISVILVAFTHFAGHELYRSGKIRGARRTWVDTGRKHDLFTSTMPLARPQSGDDQLPAYTQLCNRVGSHPGYLISAATLAIVLLIAGGATYVRGQVLEKELEARVVGARSDLAGMPAADGLDMSAQAVQLPAADAQSSQSADEKAIHDQADIDRHGGWATFIILAFVFVFLQMLGVIFGYRWGFAGENSAEAHRDIGGGKYSSYAAVREHYRRVADTAQAKLAVLQQRIMGKNIVGGTTGQHLSKTFRDFVQETRVSDAIERSNELQHARKMAEKSAAEPAQEAAPAALPQSLAAVLAQLDALGDDKAAKMALIGTLATEVRDEVMAALRQKKEEQARKALDSELEQLL